MGNASITPALQVSTGIKVTETPDGIVLLDIQHGMTYPLDTVSTLIWKRLGEGLQITEIAQHIATTYHIPEAQALGDVQEFVGQLQQSHLLDGDRELQASSKHRRLAKLRSVFRFLMPNRHDGGRRKH